MEIFEFEFIRKAFLVGILLAMILPCIGHTIVLRRMSMVGDALSHTALVGVTSGLLFGFNPVIGSIVACVLGALCMEAIRKYIPKFKENAMVIMMSASIGLAGILSSKIKSSISFSSYLFGSIVSVNDGELLMICLLVVVVFLVYYKLYHQLFHITFDEKSAKMSGINVNRINFIYTIITALTIAIASKVIGVLIVSSLLVLPILCGMQLAKSYKNTLIYGVIFSIVFMVCGLYISYYLDLRPGGSIALISVITYLILLVVKKR